MATGKIGVTTENIFPIIKKFLYSDHEIFLRELVSNAIDATQKIKTLSSFGDYKGELGDLKVVVSVDKNAGTLTVSDHGIGMDADDINKYINQIAFSGAEEFLAKYKDTANSIIGHFGLGFYSAFMVSKKVVIRSLSYKDGAKAVEWSCDGSPEFEMTEIEKAGRGTDIVLYIDDDNKDFLEQDRIDTLLKKYCRFLPVPVVSGKEKEWKDGKYVDTDKDNVVNASEPLWTKKPVDLTDEDYLKFYHELMPGNEDPMFWIHLNVDYPFTLTGILYFPKIRSNFDVQKNRIQLYCNQVYVTDQVEGVVPEFMTLMQGVIDSPDIPLNVSRSYLQADQQVKKISSYISKKVAEKLDKMFRDDRKSFEEKWDDIKIFIEYGMLTDEKFYESAKKFFLIKDVNSKYYTLDEYRILIEPEQTDKDETVVYLYSTDTVSQYTYIKACEDKGYNVLVMDGQLDSHIIGLIEQKIEKTRFVRVDSDIPERLIVKDNQDDAGLTPLQTDIMSTLIRSQIPEIEKTNFIVSFAALKESDAPATVTRNEFMRRMKEMAAMQPGAGFYGEMPDSYEIIINTNQPVVKQVVEDATTSLEKEVAPIRADIEILNNHIESLRKEASEKKESMPDISDKESKVTELRNTESEVISSYAKTQPKVKQIIDLALLQSNLLKGESLNEFIKRSISLL
ncbi:MULTISPECIES: molecular chaperone HtpG [Bacteroidales]|jgi:molecular chaperone HtpG|uniref:Molecular chaperone HtpG n=1 Tax=Lepagella muris TaxID=3032870 RepID=A0AC61RDS8_9BACT|nr:MULTISPECIES: molecular chaperone HtpG [Bacteroidales]ROT03722.1 molecular chaperone HtpG [Muribaculaceae bacterium Isolate-037 (Harlan)]TGY77103.1 molecular chaperone HtpG [Lepagella muris]THG49001.1 molecular chaperone HtpG [Bacteroidales bacterium]TKC55358.1 molecular chaperone HtpG [Bacteroidales bacterium]